MEKVDITHPDDITPEWLTYILSKAGIISSSRVTSLKKHDLAEGKAWLSSVIKIDAEYDDLGENPPRSYVLKLLSSKEYRDADYELGAYQREINFYREFSKDFPVKIPKVYYSEFGDKNNLMLMEDLSYLEPGDQITGINYRNAQDIICSLSKVHGLYWKRAQLDNLAWLPSTNKIEIDYADKWESFENLCGSFMDKESLRIGANLVTFIPRLFEEIASRPKTLVNDDIKSDNLLFGKVNSKESVVILDWQFALRSMGALDIARLIGGSLIPDERKGKQFELLRIWYNGLIKQGITDYGWDDAIRDFKLGSLANLAFPVHFHRGIVRAEGRALEYIKTLYCGLFSLAVEIEAESALR